jgi:hypothetical protein
LAEPIGRRLAPYLSSRVVINVSDRFLGTYAMTLAAARQCPALPPTRLGIAFNSPPMLAYQPVRGASTNIYYEKPFVVMGCFPREHVNEARDVVCSLFGFEREDVRAVPTIVDLALENVNSILHVVQDLENLKRGRYHCQGSLYTPDVYTSETVRRIHGVVQDRDRVAAFLTSRCFRSLHAFDGTTFRSETALQGGAPGTAEYRHGHPLLLSIPRPTAYTAHGYEDVGWSAVPLESFGAAVGAATPALTAVVDDWCAHFGTNYRAVGRTCSTLGLGNAATLQGIAPHLWPWRFGAL